MNTVLSIAKRELRGYFCTPIAYVFLIAFLVMSAIATFLVGDFFTFNEASLRTLFFWQPWLFLLCVPAAGMRLWAEERRQGTVEVLLTMPVTIFQTVLGKFLAGWLFLGIGLVLTFPLPISVAFLGDPDWGAMLTGYLGGFLLAGAFLAPFGEKERRRAMAAQHEQQADRHGADKADDLVLRAGGRQ